MTTELALRTIKGSPLTHEEVDSNFTNLRATADTAADDIASLQTDFETVTDKANASAIGVAPTDNDLGTFTGSTIADASTVKDALQALETAYEALVVTFSDFLTGQIAFNLPDEADGDAIPSPGSGLPYLSGGVMKIA